MQTWTVFFLVVLRLAIGWHFLAEGWQKVHSRYIVGKTDYNKKPFTSADYLSEAPGPLGGVVRWSAGGPNEDALARLVVLPEPKDKPHLRTPPGLKQDWENLVKSYEQHYRFDEAQKKRADEALQQAESTVVTWLTYQAPTSPAERTKNQDYERYTTEQTRGFTSPEVKRRMTLEERIADYRAKMAEVADARDRMLKLGKDVGRAKWQQLKGEEAKLRSSLLKDVDVHTTALIRELNRVVASAVSDPLDNLVADRERIEKTTKAQKDTSKLSDEEKRLHTALQSRTVAAALKKLSTSIKKATDRNKELLVLKPEDVGKTEVTPIDSKTLKASFTDANEKTTAELLDAAEAAKKAANEVKDAEAKKAVLALVERVETNTKALTDGAESLPNVGPASLTPSRGLIDWIDAITPWFLVVVGACLLLGLFTRTMAVFAAGFLLMTYLAFPSFPWLPAPPQSESSYLFVNKNVIEMLALCVLATTLTGRWFGLDALLHSFKVAVSRKKGTSHKPAPQGNGAIAAHEVSPSPRSG